MEKSRGSTAANVAIGALLFGSVGPLLGAVPAALIFWFNQRTPNGGTPQDLLLVLGLSVPFSYLLGGIPALVCGAIVGSVRDRLVRWHHSLIAGALGLTLSLCWGAFRIDKLQHRLDEPGPAMLASAGFFAATVCALLFRPKASKPVVAQPQ